MANDFFHSYKIEDRSHLSFIKREIHNAVAQAGFASQRAGEIDIIVSELCSNVVKHANGGELLYRLISGNEGNVHFELYSLDNGPGTNDIHRYMKDGLSSTNTLGHGLGSIKRLSNFFQIYSLEGWGTVAYTQVALKTVKPRHARENKFNYRVIQTCVAGEQSCGDGYLVKETNDHTWVFVGDGLGHGIHAHEAVEAARNVVITSKETDPVAILRDIHASVKKTRGLVASIAILDHDLKLWKICGVGNIHTRLCQGLTAKNYMAHNGIVGLNIPGNLKAYEVALEDYQWLTFCSDGIKTRWDVSRYPSLLKYDPAIIAAVIFKDFSRRSDDSTILIGKVNK